MKSLNDAKQQFYNELKTFKNPLEIYFLYINSFQLLIDISLSQNKTNAIQKNNTFKTILLKAFNQIPKSKIVSTKLCNYKNYTKLIFQNYKILKNIVQNPNLYKIKEFEEKAQLHKKQLTK